MSTYHTHDLNALVAFVKQACETTIPPKVLVTDEDGTPLRVDIDAYREWRAQRDLALVAQFAQLLAENRERVCGDLRMVEMDTTNVAAN